MYDKNPDEHIQPSLVPDEVIHPQTDKYWAPHPETGVFGPDSKENQAAGSLSLPANASEDSVLEKKAFFRPLEVEDLEKPLPWSEQRSWCPWTYIHILLEDYCPR